MYYLLSIAWCDNLIPNVYGTEVYLTCSLNDAQDVIIFQVRAVRGVRR